MPKINYKSLFWFLVVSILVGLDVGLYFGKHQPINTTMMYLSDIVVGFPLGVFWQQMWPILEEEK